MGETMERQCCEVVRGIYATIHASGLNKFTFALIDSLYNDLKTVLYELDCLPDAAFKVLIGVILDLGEARNELRLARFLFDVEEVNPLYRLVMRNRAVLRAERILHKVLSAWP